MSSASTKICSENDENAGSTQVFVCPSAPRAKYARMTTFHLKPDMDVGLTSGRLGFVESSEMVDRIISAQVSNQTMAQKGFVDCTKLLDSDTGGTSG